MPRRIRSRAANLSRRRRALMRDRGEGGAIDGAKTRVDLVSRPASWAACHAIVSVIGAVTAVNESAHARRAI